MYSVSTFYWGLEVFPGQVTSRFPWWFYWLCNLFLLWCHSSLSLSTVGGTSLGFALQVWMKVCLSLCVFVCLCVCVRAETHTHMSIRPSGSFLSTRLPRLGWHSPTTIDLSLTINTHNISTLSYYPAQWVLSHNTISYDSQNPRGWKLIILTAQDTTPTAHPTHTHTLSGPFVLHRLLSSLWEVAGVVFLRAACTLLYSGAFVGGVYRCACTCTWWQAAAALCGRMSNEQDVRGSEEATTRRREEMKKFL